MNRKTTSAQDPIRVSLRFGMRSDNTLVQALRTTPPYGRAKFLRGLIKEAWRSRRQPSLTSSRQDSLHRQLTTQQHRRSARQTGPAG